MAVILCDVQPPPARPTRLEAVVTVTSTPPLNAGILLRNRIKATHHTDGTVFEIKTYFFDRGWPVVS
jgi:hypothetical protein